MGWSISSALLARLEDEAKAQPGLEVCGLLLGKGRCIADAVPIRNAAADPATGFLLDPAEHLRASRRARQAGRAILGHYHSHPSGSAMPSREDARCAEQEGCLWLILAPPERGLWLSRPRGGRAAFEPLQLGIS